VLAILPEMYDDLWTGAKGMYKLEPVVADGGELILYAPHIDQVSITHGQILQKIGYHVRDYFLENWDNYHQYPWGVLAHSTHLKGKGNMLNGREQPRIIVSLATGIPEEICKQINLGYMPPDKINVPEWIEKENEGVLVVAHAGEMLYRLKNDQGGE
jgi:hypothetical protein